MYNKDISKRELLLTVVLSLLFVFGMLGVTGVLTSGYHLIDDHVLIRKIYSYRNSDSSFYEKVFAGFPWSESRFLPMCTMLRNLGYVVFEDNFVFWQIFRGIEITIALCFSYCTARQFDVNKWMAVLFSGLIMIGEQSTSWCRLGPAEPLGVMFLMTAFFFLQKFELSCKKKWFTLGTFAAVFSSWSKEAFTLVLPFIPLLMIVYDLVYINAPCKITKEKIQKSIKKNWYLLISLWGVFFWNMYHILFKFGVDFGGYAGIDESLGIFGYIKRMGGMLLFRFSFYFWGLVVAGIICLVLLWQKKKIRDFLYKHVLLLFLSIIIILSQVFLHAKSGMFDRYFIPTTVAVALIAIVVVYDVLKEYPKALLSYEIVLSCILSSFIIFTLLPYANEYAEGGKNIKDCFLVVQELADKDSIIIADIDPECNLAVESYMECQMEYPYVFSVIEDEVVDLKNIYGIDKEVTDLNEADYIISSEAQYEDYELVVENNSISLWKKK